jgi:hypothetical protein
LLLGYNSLSAILEIPDNYGPDILLHGKRTSIAGKPKEFGEEVHVPAGPLALDLE